MKLWANTLAIMLFTTVLIAEPAKPKLYQWQCPGPNGGWGWSVLEDRDGDGNYDWETKHDCDGSICEGPLGASNKRQIGYLTGWVSLSFTQLFCGESSSNSWSVRMFDENGILMGTVECSCSDITAALILPDIVQESSQGGADDRKLRTRRRQYAFEFDVTSTTWNSAASTLDVKCLVKKPLPLTIRVLERNRGQEDRLIATVVTPQPIVGENLIHVPLPPLPVGLYYCQVTAPSRFGITSIFSVETSR